MISLGGYVIGPVGRINGRNAIKGSQDGKINVFSKPLALLIATKNSWHRSSQEH